MKKIFINPEVETVELTPAESIMAVDLARSAEKATAANVVTDNVEEGIITTEYSMWKGFNN